MTGTELPQTDALEDALSRPASALAPRERRVELVAGVCFAAAVAALVGAVGTQGPELGLGTLAAGVFLAFAMNVRFDVGPGYTVPTQLAFVPLLFSAPPALVPVLTSAAVAAGSLPEVVRGRMRPSRLLLSVPNSWFAVGAAAVVAVAGPSIDPGDRTAVLAAAFAGQVLADFLAASARDVALGRATLREELAEAPWVYGVDAALAPAGLLATGSVDSAAGGVVCLVPLIGLLGVFARERRARMEGLVELNSAYRGTALVLGNVIEADDAYTGEHSRGVVELAMEVADRLRLDASRRRNLEFGALLHDVGKVAIPKDIINKPGRLDPHEWAVVRTHTVEGQRILEQIGGFMAEVGRIVRSHHERWDGTGYPDGLRGEDIPIEARIIACCDAFNAMTTTRSYRTALPPATALAELRAHAGTQFDPDVAAVVVDVVVERQPHAGALAA